MLLNTVIFSNSATSAIRFLYITTTTEKDHWFHHFALVFVRSSAVGQFYCPNSTGPSIMTSDVLSCAFVLMFMALKNASGIVPTSTTTPAPWNCPRRRRPGSPVRFQAMQGIGHFPFAKNPKHFAEYLYTRRKRSLPAAMRIASPWRAGFSTTHAAAAALGADAVYPPQYLRSHSEHWPGAAPPRSCPRLSRRGELPPSSD
jgi:hypothetical protein